MTQDLNLFAEALIFVHGMGAEQEAVRHALLCQRSGDWQTAQTWRAVQRAVRDLQPRLAA